jgi:hypothetical protein
MNLYMNLSAATLGAGFYTLFTAYKYISERTYEPAYNSINLLRFFLGIVSGVILASFGPEILGQQGGSQKFSPVVFGLIGGYASEAVNQILLRVSEVLVAVIKGSGKDDFKQREAMLQAEAKSQQSIQRQQVVTALGDVLKNAIDKQAPADVIDGIKKAMDEQSRS